MTSNPVGPAYSLRMGRVASFVPGYNSALVIVGKGAPRRAVLAFQGGGLTGARSSMVLAAGAFVLLAHNPDEEFDLIIGMPAGQVTTQSMGQSDWDTPLTKVGFVVDKLHNHVPHAHPEKMGLTNLNNSTPIDGVSGEWGMYDPMGSAVHVGPFQAFLRGGDRCGITFYGLDELARMVAKSYEIRTLSGEHSDHDDEGELNIVDQVALLPWESMGAFEAGTPTAVEDDKAELDNPDNPPTKTPVDLVQPDQRAIYRLKEFTGYLGDMWQRFVGLPIGGTGLDRQGQNADKFQGVFRESISADGAYSVQSAKGITLEKWSLIPFPLQGRADSDPEGDSRADYKASGEYGEGEDHKREDFEFGGRPDSLVHGMLSLEHHGFMANRMGLQNFTRHKKDWTVAEESGLPLKATLGQGTYTDGNGYILNPAKMWMPLPKVTKITIQKGRWENVSYYASRSAIQQLDDGSILIEDGYGGQILMSGGNIVMSCPGDIVQAPGRSIVQMAPQDIIQKAGNSIDITATRRDVRIKAERNLMALGGNSGEGGVLIESKDRGGEFDFSNPGEKTDIQGLVFRSAEGHIATVGKRVGIAASEDLILQAKDASVVAETSHFDVEQSVTIVAGGTLGNTDPESLTHYRFASDTLHLGLGKAPAGTINVSTMVLQGTLNLDGGGTWRGAYSVEGSLSATQGVSGPSEDVTLLTSQQINQIETAASDSFDRDLPSNEAAAIKVNESSREALRDATTGQLYFNVTAVESVVSFSLRTDADYRTVEADGFSLPRFRWQEFAEAGGATKKWKDKPVLSPQGQESWSWPGNTAWASSARQAVHTGANFASGLSSDRTGTGQASLAVEMRVLADNYIVNSHEAD